jgi:hypothetical protein
MTMAHSLTWLDRVRIERAVWSLDQRLYDLPTRSRVAKRREVRANLLTAAQDVGTTAALRHLGSPRELAGEYLSAEFGNGPRPHWIAAAVFLLTGQLFFTELLHEAAAAFAAGITTANPHVTGSFAWSGLGYIQSAVTYTFADGKGEFVGGAWTPLAYALWATGTVLVGRLWHAVTRWRRRDRQPISV